MSMLDKYLERQSLVIDAFGKIVDGVYSHIVGMNVFLLLYDRERAVIGFWPVYDRAHAFQVEAVKEQDDFVTVFHPHGKLELSPPLPDQAADIETWRHQMDMESMIEELREIMDGVAKSPKPREKKRKRRYQTAIEHKWENHAWHIGGAWAVNKREIAFHGAPGFPELQHYRLAQIANASAKPLELYEYVIESANVLTDIVPYKEIEAPDAGTAAMAAVIMARQEVGLEKA